MSHFQSITKSGYQGNGQRKTVVTDLDRKQISKTNVNDFSYNKRSQSGIMYFAIAATPSGQTFSRAFNKTLTNITQTYLMNRFDTVSYNITIDTLTIDLPENGSFSSSLLEHVCEQFEGKHVIAVLVIGDSPAALTVTMTAKHVGIPVLWAKGNAQVLQGFKDLSTSPLEVHLAPTGKELVHALRALLLQAHWHTCTVLADSPSFTALQRGELWLALSESPLHPIVIALPHRPQSIFRKLADISRLTRGVIVLFCDRVVAIRILEDAKRLNMMDGHFVWIWFDTAQNESYKNMTEDTNKEYKDNDRDKKVDKSDIDYLPHKNDYNDNSKLRFKRGVHKELFESDFSDSHLNLLLKNEKFLLINNNHDGVESSKFKKRNEVNNNNINNINVKTRKKQTDDKLSNLPSGLLSLRPLPIRLDRHLVKGAVRLLVTTLKVTLDRCPDWLLENIAAGELQSSCWKPASMKEFNFSTIFAR
ncbi:hypothetical protein RN001_012355 [Aquatica leii]|uniref:Receptor ligand binding region domain-containing protein n=1 Tax=Aquatica leii TaxID=1421715 RepID=A0AAN7P5D3_9COLE|nr:hypothetical protein RN001_012355 [Aquatica leii]